MSESISDVKKQAALRTVHQILVKRLQTGVAACYREWTAMVIRKKALAAAWIAQKKALAKIESAKSMEMKQALNKEQRKVAHQLTEMQSSNRKGNAMRGLQTVLRRWLWKPQASALKKFQIAFYVDRALKENVSDQAASVQEAVQAPTFETQLKMKQVTIHHESITDNRYSSS